MHDGKKAHTRCGNKRLSLSDRVNKLHEHKPIGKRTNLEQLNMIFSNVFPLHLCFFFLSLSLQILMCMCAIVISEIFIVIDVPYSHALRVFFCGSKSDSIPKLLWFSSKMKSFEFWCWFHTIPFESHFNLPEPPFTALVNRDSQSQCYDLFIQTFANTIHKSHAQLPSNEWLKSTIISSLCQFWVLLFHFPDIYYSIVSMKVPQSMSKYAVVELRKGETRLCTNSKYGKNG